MKKNVIVLLFVPIFSWGQDSILLKKFCPTKQDQEGGLCFAYAPVYTALSIEHNIALNQTDENAAGFNVFSYGFVASEVKKSKSFTRKIFNKCGKKATVDMALGVLLSTGTVPYVAFPETCSCGKVGDNETNAKQYKIKDTAIIGEGDTEAMAHIAGIKSALSRFKPVIIAIYQESFFSENRSYVFTFPENYQQNKKSANHVICIVGYNDTVNGGSFLIKNNTKIWGQGGFSYIRYLDMIKLIRGSYIINI